VARAPLTPDLDPIVEFDDVGLFLPVRARRKGGGRRQRLRRMAGETTQDKVWQVRHSTFQVAEGESLAIVGYKESGRDVLLRLAAGTLVADEGTVRRRVPVVPVIQVGRAFNRNYTVRQNIYLVGGLLGMTPEQVKERLPGIVATAGVEKVVDKYFGQATGVVRVQLAWAVAMATEARAYAISQVIAVGEPAAKARAWKRMEAMREDGVTFLVTSDKDADLLRFCDRAILIDKDTIVAQTSVEDALERLHKIKRSKTEEQYVVEESSDDDDDEFL
jgi:ABC-2 type transport system ATP-binding protein